MTATIEITGTSEPKLTPIVSYYEQVISKNRERGFDTDLLGNKSTLPAPFCPEKVSRRQSECCYSHRHLVQNQAQTGKIDMPALRRRMTTLVVDAMSSSSSDMFPRQHPVSNNTVASNKKESLPVGSVMKSLPAKPSPEVQPTKIAKESKMQNKMKKEEEDLMEDEELKLLEQRVALLQTKLEKVESDEKDELIAIEEKKKQCMRNYRENQRKHFVPGVATLTHQDTLKFFITAKNQQKMIDELRLSNKKLRNLCDELAPKIGELKKENDALMSERIFIEKYYYKLCNLHSSVENVNCYFTDILPKFRSKVEEFDSEAASRAAFIAMDKRIKAIYDTYLERILATLETKCNDSELVDRVISMAWTRTKSLK